MKSQTSHSAATLSVIVPVYNSQASLAPLVERLQAVLAEEASLFELIFVNDGSSDSSWAQIEELSAEHEWVSGINLMRNYGQHNALLCGIREAQYEIIVTVDDDLQNPPEEIPKLLSGLADGMDVVYGTPIHEQHGLFRNLASQITKLALRSTMGAKTAQKVSAFRAFRSITRDAFAAYDGPFVNIDVLLTWATSSFGSVKVKHDPRRYGQSSYTLKRLITHALNMITGFSTFPLQLASWTGFVFAFFGLLLLIYVVGRFLIQGGSVPGFSFIASTIAIFSGVQLFALGIIGEYLSRMYFRTLNRPSYVVRSQQNRPQ